MNEKIENIKEVIEDTKQQIEWKQKDMNKAAERFKEKVATASAEDIAYWCDSWMNDIKNYSKRIQELKNELYTLESVLRFLEKED